MIDTNKIEKIRTQESVPTPEDGFDGEVITGIVSDSGKRLIAVKYPDGWYYSELSNKLNFKDEKLNVELKKEIKKALLLTQQGASGGARSGGGGGSFLPLTGGTMTGTVHMDDDVKLEFGDADEYIKGDGSQLIVSSSNQIDFNNSRLYDVNRITFNDATSQTTAPVNRWSIQTGGYKTNNNSATTYYFQYRPNGEIWANSDGSIASIAVYDTYASMLVAPYDGKVTKISVHGYATDTGATDPLKFYVFKGTPSSGATNLSLTQIGVTGTITPADTRQFVENTDISSSNTFSENDSIYVMYKKDSTTANQDLYFSITVSGEYTS